MLCRHAGSSSEHRHFRIAQGAYQAQAEFWNVGNDEQGQQEHHKKRPGGAVELGDRPFEA